MKISDLHQFISSYDNFTNIVDDDYIKSAFKKLTSDSVRVLVGRVDKYGRSPNQRHSNLIFSLNSTKGSDSS